MTEVHLRERAAVPARADEPLLLAALARRNAAGRRSGSCARRAAITGITRRCARGMTSSSCASSPELAAEVTHGPIEEFGFDAAILFSDLLFPLEAMGMGLRYAARAEARLAPARDRRSCRGCSGGAARAAHMTFQARGNRAAACAPAAPSCALIGFVGGSLHALCLCGRRLARGLRARRSRRPG